MDPITLAIITLFVLATGGATTAAVRKRQRTVQRAAIREHLQARRPIAGTRVALFDVFWDLGASDFALELMAHHYLLPHDAGDEEILGTWSRLEDLVIQHGGYGEFLRDSLDAIQEFFREHQSAGHRRRLPGLSDAARRVIPVPRRLGSDNHTDNLPARADHSQIDSPLPDEKGVQRRRTSRTSGAEGSLHVGGPQESVDLDEVGNLKPLEILQSILEGDFGDRLEKWWKMRRLRQLRTDLDDTLREFYQFYADAARRQHDFYDPLYDAHRRWKDETTRLRFAARRRPWSGAPYELSADVLFDLAIELSNRLAAQAYRSTYQVIETIHDHARRGDLPMAGYLVYLNRHPFFAGRHPEYADLARKIEYATHRVREEIVKLRDEGVV